MCCSNVNSNNFAFAKFSISQNCLIIFLLPNFRYHKIEGEKQKERSPWLTGDLGKFQDGHVDSRLPLPAEKP